MSLKKGIAICILLLSAQALASNLSRTCFFNVRNEARALQVEASAILRNVEEDYSQQMQRSGEATITVQARNEANTSRILLEAIQSISEGQALSVTQTNLLMKLCKDDLNIYKAINN